MCWSMLSVAGAIDYEDDAENDVIVRVTDSVGSILLRRFSVDVVDVNDVPHVRIYLEDSSLEKSNFCV